jgi:hypothetical protein
VSYDPKAKRPPTETDEQDAAPVDRLLGAVPTPESPDAAPVPPAGVTTPEPGPTDDPITPARATPVSDTPAPQPLPAPVPARRTVGTVIAAAVAVVIVLIGWRRRRSRR